MYMSAAPGAQPVNVRLLQEAFPMRKLRVAVVLAALVSQVPLRAATLQVFESQAAFLAATGAADATGPLPDLGDVANASNPGGSATINTVTFSLAPGGDSLSIGAGGTGAAPDWYPQTAGHDIALGFENLRVETAAPVFALGFEIVEPDATMPAWGGTPVDSTLQIRLFLNGAPVGEFVAGDLPKDVVTFIGVWSDTAFDRVEIVDLTGTTMTSTSAGSTPGRSRHRPASPRSPARAEPFPEARACSPVFRRTRRGEQSERHFSGCPPRARAFTTAPVRPLSLATLSPTSPRSCPAARGSSRDSVVLRSRKTSCWDPRPLLFEGRSSAAV
jgi:hypothetical protein